MMLERFKRESHGSTAPRHDGAVATAERNETTAADEPRTVVDERPERPTTERTTTTRAGAATPTALETARARQRDEFGGVNWGASFFGWLVAVGVAALLTSLLVAAGAAIGLTESDVTTGDTEELTLAGGIALLVVVMIAYYAGGYVAGRMSRFDGARQGIAAWAIGLIVTVGFALAAVVLGDEYNVLEQLNLPALPTGDESFATGGAIALVAIALGSLLAAMTGGKLGERYHKKVDRVGFVDDERITSHDDGYARDKAASHRPV
jgi:hypothetical protein